MKLYDYPIRETDVPISEKINASETVSPENRISFGSLANGLFKCNENYRNWKDGIGLDELSEEWIKELADEIAAIYGYDTLQVSKQYFIRDMDGNLDVFDNVGIDVTNKHIYYDPIYLQSNGNRYGIDNTISSLSHEVGHQIVENIGLREEISPYENEACADYIAGLTSRLCKLNPAHRLAWYSNVGSDVTYDEHPERAVRIMSFIRGFDRIDRGDEAHMIRVFEDFSPYDIEGVYRNAALLRKILYEDVINPLRRGEFQKF